MKKELINKIILNSVNQKVKTIKQIIGEGIVNEVFIVETQNRKLLLRINSLYSFEEFKKEEYCIKKASENGINVPNIITIGKFEKYAYSIYDYIEGENAKYSKLNKLEIWNKLWKYAQIINSIEVNGFGDRFSSKDKKFHGSFKRFVDYNIRSLSKKDELIKRKIYSIDQIELIKNFFKELKDKKWKIGLTHNDLSLKNLIINNQGIYIIDCGSAEANMVPYFEFVEIMGCYLDLNVPKKKELEAFLEGYGVDINEFELMKGEISKLILLVSFDKLRWAIDKSPDKIKEYSARTKKRLSYALDLNQD